jgi:hypothetical protein
MKEITRLYLALLLAEDPASLDALGAAQQPSGQLSIPPRSAAPTALQAAMHAFLAAGASLLATGSDDRCAGMGLAQRVNAHLTTEPRTRKKASARPPPKAALGTTAPLAYCASWLGGRVGGAPATRDDAPDDASAWMASCAGNAPSAVSVVSSVLSASFRGAFLPLWVHAHVHGYRISRLDEPQYNAVHAQSPAHELVAQLDDASTLCAQRAALASPEAPLFSLARACDAMGTGAALAAAFASEAQHPVPPDAPGGGAARAAYDAEAALLRLPAREAAMAFVFARTSALRSQALAYDLGPRTRALQLRALVRRLLADAEVAASLAFDPDAVVAALPKHSTHLYCCTECRRIVNACQDSTGKDATFNEIGLAASMLRVDGSDLADGHMRCAKRSSAALRTAVTLEDAARTLEIESMEPPTRAEDLPRDVRPPTIAELPARDGCNHTSDIAKMRRDIKNCIDQQPRATACGDVPLVCIPVLGRAMRIFGDWYALCALCGALTRVHADARFGAEPCCMRCDYAMLHGKQDGEALVAEAAQFPAAQEREARLRRKCRFCGRAEVPNTGSKFKVLFAPLDSAGGNANVPPPLRTCRCDYLSNHRPKFRIHAAGIRLTPLRAHFALSYCPLHYRPWLLTAHETLPINVILAHISARARPVHGAETGRRDWDTSAPPKPPPAPRSRRAGGKARSVPRPRPRPRPRPKPKSGSE